MEFDSPIRNRDGEIIININITNNFTCHYTSNLNTPVPDGTNDLNIYVSEMSKEFEKYSKKWLTSKILSEHFINNLSNIWIYDTIPDNPSKITGSVVRQTWIPTHIHFSRGKYNLNWKLISSDYGETNLVSSSGQNDDFNIPYADESIVATILQSPRAKVKHRIRKARIKATACKLKLNMLLDSYYEKYGTFEGVDKESPLSSDIDSNPEMDVNNND